MIYMCAFYPNNPYHFPHSVLCWMLNTGIFYSMINGDQAEVASKLLYKFCLGSKELDNSKNKSKAPKDPKKKMNLKYLLFLTSLNQQWPSNVPFPFSTLKGQRFLLKKDY